ncbi:MAG: hypothetical protein FD140_4899 [Limisphaerales bacterium]|nr:MAG: hypothetical protein FD140_4899 [Limisphaerales bacterium]
MATKAKQLDLPENHLVGKVKEGGDKTGKMVTGKKPGKTVAANKVEEERELVRKFDAWTVEIGEKTDQCFDNHPRHILKVFPKVDDRKVTETQLAQRLWWWRRANEKEAQSIFRHQGVPQWAQMLPAFSRGHFEHSAYRRPAA